MNRFNEGALDRDIGCCLVEVLSDNRFNEGTQSAVDRDIDCCLVEGAFRQSV